MISVSIAAGLLLFRPAIHSGSHNKYQANKVESAHKKQGKLLTVSLNDRYYYLAQKLPGNQYELLYVPKHNDIVVGDVVRTTGQDMSFSADKVIGQVTHMNSNDESLYLYVRVGTPSQ